MRILLATNDPHLPQRYGGAYISTHELARFLGSRSHKTGVLCRLVPGGKTYWTNSVRRALGKKRFPRDSSLGYPTYRGWGVGEPAHLDDAIPEVIKEFKPDVILVQGGQSINLATAALKLGIPAAVYLRDTEFSELPLNPSEFSDIFYIANSRFTSQKFFNDFGLPSAIIPPLVFPDAYRVKSKADSVLFVNPHPKKGLEIALKLAAARPDIPFVFQESWILSPNSRQALLNALSTLPNVELRAPQQDMRKAYRRTKLVLAPSQWEEAWGRVATEAQISGIPVLGSNRGGLPDSIGDGGIVIPYDAPHETWLEALSSLWDDHTCYVKYSDQALVRSKREELRPDYLASSLEGHLDTCIKNFKPLLQLP